MKYDGSNLRFEYSPKKGWHKFGTRKTMIDVSHPVYGSGIEMFLERFGDDMIKVFKKDKYMRSAQNITVFAEWFGAKSLGGAHRPKDPKNIVPFDVNVHKRGFLNPKEFIDSFGHLQVAELIWQGEFNDSFVDDVKKENIDIESKYDVRASIPEGVIVKGGSSHRLWMCKIKTERYKEALKAVYQQDWVKYWE